MQLSLFDNKLDYDSKVSRCFSLCFSYRDDFMNRYYFLCEIKTKAKARPRFNSKPLYTKGNGHYWLLKNLACKKKRMKQRSF